MFISIVLFKRARLGTLIEYEKKMLSNKNWVSWDRDDHRCEKTLCLIKKIESKKSRFSENHLRNQKLSIFIKSIFKINHRLIRKTVEFKSNRNIIETKLYNGVTIFENYENAENFDKLIKKIRFIVKKKTHWSKFLNWRTCWLFWNLIELIIWKSIEFIFSKSRIAFSSTKRLTNCINKKKWTKNFIFLNILFS